MLVPLVILAILSVIGGWIGVPESLGGTNHFEHFLGAGVRVDAEARAGNGCGGCRNEASGSTAAD